MKRTKAIAALLTATMVLSHVPVIAAETDTEGWIEEQEGELEVFQLEEEPVFEAEEDSLPESAMEIQEVFQSEPAEEELFIAGEEGLEAMNLPLTVIGGTEGTDYQYVPEQKELRLLTETPLTITGSTTEYSIMVWDKTTANLTIENLHMDIQNGNGIDLSYGKTLNLTLKGNNQIYPGGGKAGICVPSGTTLNISGEGALDVRGGRAGGAYGGAGIGVNPSGTLGNIQIHGGRITARSVNAGSAGIGAGGWGGPTAGSSITITGGYVNASAFAGDEGSINAGTIGITGGIVEVPDGNLSRENVTKSDCLIAENHVVKSYGTFTLPMDYTVPAGSVLEVPDQASLNTGDFTLVNNGKIINYSTIQGAIQNNGRIINYGTLPDQVNGEILNSEEVSYIDENGAEQRVKAVPFSVSSDQQLTAGWHVVMGNVTIDSRFQVNGTVNLILADGASLKVQGGIGVTEGKTLKIYGQKQGTGRLVADAGGKNDAGIGGNDLKGQRNSGTLEVHGGTVEAYARGAGIGGASVSKWKEHAGNNGTVIITGGTVIASSTGGAGIGGGVRNDGYSSNGGGGVVTITGGIVKASASYAGSAIGAGGSGVSTGTITINGDAVVYADSTNQDGLGAIGDKSNVSKGVIFETIKDVGNGQTVKPADNKVYGDVTLKEDLELPPGVELEVPAGGSLTIPEGVTVKVPEGTSIQNNGAINGNGAIVTDGTLAGTGTVGDTITEHKRSEATVTVTVEGEAVKEGAAPYGSAICIKAAVDAKQTRSNAINTENVVDFYLGDKSGIKLNQESIKVENNVAQLNLTLTGEHWNASETPYTITAVFSGNGTYKRAEGTGSLTVNKLDLSKATVTLENAENQIYTGMEHSPTVKSVVLEQQTLNAGTDYEVTYKDNINAGTASAIITGKGNFAGTAGQTFTIAKASPSLTITTDKSTYVYEETIICQVSASAQVTDEVLGTLSIWDGGKKLAEKASVGNKETVEFVINEKLDAGTRKLTVKFTGNTNIANVDSEEYHTYICITPKPYEITLTGKATGYSEVTLDKAKVTPEDATVTYAVNTRNVIPEKGWQEGLVFSNLSSGTTYYFFAKAATKGNYAEAISKGVAISTWSIPVIEPTPTPLPDNVPDGSVVENGNIVTPEGNVIKPDGTIVLPDGTVIAPEDGKKPSINKEETVTTPNGTEIEKEGTITVPGMSTESKEDDVTITTGTNGKKPQLEPDTGSVTTPEGGSVIVPDGQGGKTKLEVPEGSIVTSDGLVTFPDGTVINEKGEVHRPDESIWDLEGNVIRPATPVLETVVVPGGNNKVKAMLSKECAGAMGYDFVISKNPNCIVDKDYTQVSKNQLDTSGEFFYIQKGTYYVYCHAWTKNREGKKEFGKWSGGQKVEVTAETPAPPRIRKVSVFRNKVTVTYTKAADAEGYDVILGKALKKVNGELRPVDYGKAVKKIKNKDTVTVTFKKVPKGTYYVGLHTYNRTSQNGKKVFSPWSNVRKVKVQ